MNGQTMSKSLSFAPALNEPLQNNKVMEYSKVIEIPDLFGGITFYIKRQSEIHWQQSSAH